MPNLDPAVIALIGTIFGGVGLKVAEHWLGRSRVRVDDAARMRDELRIEITAQREEIKALENEVDRWRNDYYALRDQYVEVKTELTLALAKIKADAHVAEEVIQAIDKPPPPRV